VLAWGYGRGERDGKKSVYAEAWRHKAGRWGIDSHGDNDFVWADEDKS